MNIKDLNQFINRLPEEVLRDASTIIANEAVNYFKENFEQKKGFDGNPWMPNKKPKTRGSLMIDSGMLKNSIFAPIKNRNRVVISAGNDKTPYAKAHNEGVNQVVSIKPFQRKRKGKIEEVRAHSRRVQLPKRQFMGHSKELNQILHDKISKYIESKIKNL